MALAPGAGGGVGADEEEGYSRGNNDDEWDDEGHPPCFVGGQALGLDQGVKDGGHEKVGDAAAGVAKSTCEGVGCADDVLVEESSRPDLTWYEATAQDTDEKSKS